MLRIVFLGELDCGKSTLIGRLLYDTESLSNEAKEEFIKVSQELGKDLEFAYLLDSFEEERRGEFTLDTTQAFMRYKNREYLLIDVPGHKELIRNMLTGSSYANLAIVVCDVEKSLEEQTRRHIYLLKFLGIDEFMVVVNKMDEVGYDNSAFEKVKKEINDFLEALNLKPLCIIPVSAKPGENIKGVSEKMGWCKDYFLLQAIEGFSVKKEKSQNFRFPIQDIYIFEKKEIVVGTVASGNLQVKDKVKVAPEEITVQIEEIMVLNKKKKEAKPHESIGLILDKKRIFRRGQVIYKEPSPQVTSEFPAEIFSLCPVSQSEEFLFKSNTQKCLCRIFKINEVIDTVSLKKRFTGELEYAETAKVILKTERPLVIEKFSQTPELGRFILHKNGKVYAIGIIP